MIGLKENSTGRSGTVYVRTRATKEDGREVLEFVRWVMVAKRDPASPAPAPVVPELPDHVAADRLTVPAGLRPRHFDRVLSGSMYRYDSYEIGERIDHVAGMTIDEAEHRLATRSTRTRRACTSTRSWRAEAASAALWCTAVTC